MSAVQTYRMDWEGIALSIRWTPHWLNMAVNGEPVAHLEITSAGRAPLPVTETGYRSHFTSAEAVAREGGPVAYVRQWLDCESLSDEWQAQQEARRQLALF